MSLTRAPHQLKRFFATQSGNGVQHLKERALIELKGPDACDFLQGVITNDINHIADGAGSMYSMFLNVKGRVLFDALIYKMEEKNCFWIECDSASTSALQKHLKIYKVRRKVEVSCLDYQVHVLFNLGNISVETDGHCPALNDFNCDVLPKSSTHFTTFKDLLLFKDPRVAQLGFRVISKPASDIIQAVQSLGQCSNTSNYRKLRYSLGVGEGSSDLLFGTSFPLECNCDYLHGVSFHKGCYIGQELTARSHHTGVIRKRLMPLFFSKIPTSLPENSVITHNSVNLGKLRGIEGNLGLALLRINQALEFENISVGNGEARVVRPFWWPVELPKEKLNVHSPS